MERNLTEIMESAYRDGDPDSALETAAVLRNLLLARLYVTKFLLNNGQAAYERAESEFASFTQQAGRMQAGLQNPARKQLATKISGMAASYIETLRKIYGTIQQRNGVVAGTLDKIGPEVADAIESKKLEIKGIQDDLGPRVESAVTQAETVMIVVGLVALVLGIAAAYLIGTGITRPIGAMTSAMGRLAEKDMSTEIPATGNKDEIGDMARAVQVFKGQHDPGRQAGRGATYRAGETGRARPPDRTALQGFRCHFDGGRQIGRFGGDGASGGFGVDERDGRTDVPSVIGSGCGVRAGLGQRADRGPRRPRN